MFSKPPSHSYPENLHWDVLLSDILFVRVIPRWDEHRSIRVPLIIRDPRMKDERRGTTNDEFTLNIDLAPTILGAAGLPIPKRMMGRDVSQLYVSPVDAGSTGTTEWRDEFFYEHPMINKKTYVPR